MFNCACMSGLRIVSSINFIVTHCDFRFAQGSESDIRAKFYSMAFRQEYEEDSGVVGWKIVDYEFAGDVPYL